MLSLFAMQNVSFPFQSACEELFLTFEWLERDFKAEIMLTVSHEWSQKSK